MKHIFNNFVTTVVVILGRAGRTVLTLEHEFGTTTWDVYNLRNCVMRKILCGITVA